MTTANTTQTRLSSLAAVLSGIAGIECELTNIGAGKFSLCAYDVDATAEFDAVRNWLLAARCAAFSCPEQAQYDPEIEMTALFFSVTIA